jgi:L-asparaginase / beta-aspartyl-peptidase
MKPILLFILLLFSIALFAQDKRPGYALVIHGGAGAMSKASLGTEKERVYLKKLDEVLHVGDSLLKNGATSLDAVEACIRIMEDSPLFNAGKGAVFTADGKNELDASIMDGKTHKAGAVAGVTIIKNPITAAHRVMTHTEHVMLTGKGAEQFAKEQGLEIVKPSYFRTDDRWDDYLKAKNHADSLGKEKKHGTVGCVALDKYGNLAAGTSTGGMTFKKFGRVGDSPIIGAGTYADNASCAVSCTGHGEYFIRNVVAYDISALMLYKGWSLQKATDDIVNRKLKEQHASGGLIAIDKDGNIAMPFNSTGMFRGYITSYGEKLVAIYSHP